MRRRRESWDKNKWHYCWRRSARTIILTICCRTLPMCTGNTAELRREAVRCIRTYTHTYTHMTAPTSRERPKKNLTKPKQIFINKTQHTVLIPKTLSENRLLNMRPHRLSGVGCFSCTAFWVFSMVGAHIWMSLATDATGWFRERLGHRRHTNTPTCTHRTVCDWQRTCVAVNTN